MLRVIFALNFCALLLVLAAPLSVAGAASKVRVLLVTGNKSYEREPFLDVFRSNPRLAVTHLEHSGIQADAWERADLEACDVVVLYDMPREITDKQKQRFTSLFARGTGLLVLHHALVSFQSWSEYERIVGGRYIDVPEKGGDPRETPSGYQHDVDIPVRVVPNHPVTRGLSDFTIHDEIYWAYRVSPSVKPLLTTTHPKSGNPLAWEKREGKSRLVYLQLGHGPSAYNDANFRKLIANAIDYVAGR
jgi:uncharacterized protein